MDGFFFYKGIKYFLGGSGVSHIIFFKKCGFARHPVNKSHKIILEFKKIMEQNIDHWFSASRGGGGTDYKKTWKNFFGWEAVLYLDCSGDGGDGGRY